MKTIIAATDYSSDAHYAVHYAARLASCFNAQLLLFNAFQLSVHASNSLVSPAAVDQMVLNNEKRLARLKREISRTYHVRVKCITYVSVVEEELEKLVEQYDADLVVMGMQNHFTENKLFGNTTTSVLRRATFPVLVIPFGVVFHNIEKILFARDEKAIHEEDKNLKLLREMADVFDAEVQVFHVEKMPVVRSAKYMEEVQEDELEQVLNGTHHTYKVANADKVAESIEEEMKAYQPDLLVMVPHKGSFMDYLLKRSMTRRMVMETQIPLLALPDVSKEVISQKSPV